MHALHHFCCQRSKLLLFFILKAWKNGSILRYLDQILPSGMRWCVQKKIRWTIAWWAFGRKNNGILTFRELRDLHYCWTMVSHLHSDLLMRMVSKRHKLCVKHGKYLNIFLWEVQGRFLLLQEVAYWTGQMQYGMNSLGKILKIHSKNVDLLMM